MALRRSGDLLGWHGDGAASTMAAIHPKQPFDGSGLERQRQCLVWG